MNRILYILIFISFAQIGFFGCKDGKDTETVDQSAPQITDREIFVYQNNSDNLSIQWKRAVDETTLYDQILYSVYFSKTSDINSLENITLKGTLLFQSVAEGALGTQLDDVDIRDTLITKKNNQQQIQIESNLIQQAGNDPGGEHSYMTLKIKGLSSATDYFFNIVAEDEAGNQTLYQMISKTTKAILSLNLLFSPDSGSYDRDQFVSISATPSEGTTIYLSTDPSADKGSFNPYSSDLFVEGEEYTITNKVLRAYARNLFFPDTEIISSEYTIDYNKVSIPQFDLTPDTYDTIQWVPISSQTPGADIYYTTNGSIPTTHSTLYTSPVQISDTPNPNFVTLRAIAVISGKNNSDIKTAEYKIVFDQVSPPVFSPASSGVIVVQGTETIPKLSFFTGTSGAEIYYTLDGSIPTESSFKFINDVTMDTQRDWSVRARAFKMGMAPSATVTNEYAIIPSPPEFYLQSTPICTGYSTSSYQLIAGCFNIADLSMDSPTSGTNIHYTLHILDEPTESSPIFSVPFTVNSFLRSRAIVKHPIFGLSNESKAYINFSISTIFIDPSLSPHTNVYTAACPISITLDSSTDGVNYTWRKISGEPERSITGNSFDYTHDNTTDAVRIWIYGRKWTSYKYSSHSYRCSSI